MCWLCKWVGKRSKSRKQKDGLRVVFLFPLSFTHPGLPFFIGTGLRRNTCSKMRGAALDWLPKGC
jgi:hypothetical protein